MRSILIIALTAFVLAGHVMAQGGAAKGPKNASPEVEKAAILKLEDEMNKARLNGDGAALKRLYADDFAGINAGGGMSDKAGIVNFYSEDGSVIAVHSTDEVSVRVMGGAAVVTARLKYQYNKRMENQSVRWMRYTRIYEKRPSGWVAVGEHYSFTPAPEE